MIIGGLVDCNDSISSIKKAQRGAVVAVKWANVADASVHATKEITFTERDVTSVAFPHNDPLVLELLIADCEPEDEEMAKVFQSKVNLAPSEQTDPSMSTSTTQYEETTNEEAPKLDKILQVNIDLSDITRCIGIGANLEPQRCKTS
ncbi:unnamed protein product [Cochlearia groenlandica]